MNDMKQKDNTMRATPETNDNCGEILDANEEFPQEFEWNADGSWVAADFARRLERERDAALEELANLRMENNHNWQAVDDLEKVTGLAHELWNALEAILDWEPRQKDEVERIAYKLGRESLTKAKEVLGEA